MKQFIKKNSSTILSIIASIGVVGTGVLAIKETKKATKKIEELKNKKPDIETKEIVKETAPIYIPSILMGASTILCIVGANVINKKTQASCISAYALLNEAYKEYRETTKDIYGEDADEKILSKIIEKDLNTYEILRANDDLYISSENGFEDIEDTSDIVTFYDPFLKQYFETSISNILAAEYHMNRNFVFNGCVNMNEFYDFLGLDYRNDYPDLGWIIDDGYYWLDFYHRKVEIDNGSMTCYIWEPMFEPRVGYLE